MANIVLFDPADVRDNLKPLTLTRPVALLRRGIMTIAEKWQRMLPGDYSFAPADKRMEPLFGAPSSDPDAIRIAGNVEPTPALAEAVGNLTRGERLMAAGRMIAYRGCESDKTIEFEGDVYAIDRPVDIFAGNHDALVRDFAILTAGRTSAPLDATCRLLGDPSQLFIEEGAKLQCCTINVAGGPVYIGRDAEVMEGVNIRGSLALLDHSVLNMGAKVYGGTTIGPHSKVGGEINNVVITGFSNKAHDGFLGNAVLGEWCNIGAGSVSSNLKNNYLEPRLWNYRTRSFESVGMQFCGLIMGDHSKAGINTMFNTATMVGIGCNVYGAGFPRTFIPSFQVGGASGFTTMPFARFIDTASRVMARRHVTLTPEAIEFLRALYTSETSEA